MPRCCRCCHHTGLVTQVTQVNTIIVITQGLPLLAAASDASGFGQVLFSFASSSVYYATTETVNPFTIFLLFLVNLIDKFYKL